MEVRKFRGATIQDVTKTVKKKLGPEALILSTRKLNKINQSGTDVFEIWAVKGEKKEGDMPVKSTKHSGSIETIQYELKSIRELLYVLSNSELRIEEIVEHPQSIDLYLKMIKGGISEKNATTFFKKSGALESHEANDFVRFCEGVFGEMLKAVTVVDPFEVRGEQIVAALVGPTGVGKTTTVAKLVADLMLKKKRTVGLISIDNYRIAAVDQLKTYAAILGVPCFPAFNTTDLQIALRRLSDKDIILIDTAGQSHYDTERMRELGGLMRVDKSIKCHLLLSTSTSESEMDAATKSFGKLNCCSYIFTKTDETKARGVIVNQILKTRMPISYVTNGQRVPEDIIKATKTGILSLVFE